MTEPQSKKASTRQPPPGRRAGYGRAKGTPNKVTREMKAVARAILFDNPKVEKHYKKKAEDGRLSDTEFRTLMEYGYRKQGGEDDPGKGGIRAVVLYLPSNGRELPQQPRALPTARVLNSTASGE